MDAKVSPHTRIVFAAASFSQYLFIKCGTFYKIRNVKQYLGANKTTLLNNCLKCVCVQTNGNSWLFFSQYNSSWILVWYHFYSQRFNFLKRWSSVFVLFIFWGREGTLHPFVLCFVSVETQSYFLMVLHQSIIFPWDGRDPYLPITLPALNDAKLRF